MNIDTLFCRKDLSSREEYLKQIDDIISNNATDISKVNSVEDIFNNRLRCVDDLIDYLKEIKELKGEKIGLKTYANGVILVKIDRLIEIAKYVDNLLFNLSECSYADYCLSEFYLLFIDKAAEDFIFPQDKFNC